MSLRTNVWPVDMREMAEVRWWKRAERKINKAGDVKESILASERSRTGGMRGREERDEAERMGVGMSLYR